MSSAASSAASHARCSASCAAASGIDSRFRAWPSSFSRSKYRVSVKPVSVQGASAWARLSRASSMPGWDQCATISPSQPRLRKDAPTSVSQRTASPVMKKLGPRTTSRVMPHVAREKRPARRLGPRPSASSSCPLRTAMRMPYPVRLTTPSLTMMGSTVIVGVCAGKSATVADLSPGVVWSLPRMGCSPVRSRRVAWRVVNCGKSEVAPASSTDMAARGLFFRAEASSAVWFDGPERTSVRGLVGRRPASFGLCFAPASARLLDLDCIQNVLSVCHAPGRLPPVAGALLTRQPSALRSHLPARTALVVSADGRRWFPAGRERMPGQHVQSFTKHQRCVAARVVEEVAEVRGLEEAAHIGERLQPGYVFSVLSHAGLRLPLCPLPQGHCGILSQPLTRGDGKRFQVQRLVEGGDEAALRVARMLAGLHRIQQCGCE